MRRSKGFTLVEIMIAIAILSVIATLAYKTMIHTQTTYRTHRDMTEATQNARIAMETVSSDLRQASYGKDATQASILYAGLDSVSFIADMYDSIPGAETVSLYLTSHLDSATQNPSDRLIYRSIVDTSGVIIVEGPVAYGVADSGLTFIYFDRDGDQMSFPIVQPEHVAEIEIAVTAQTAHLESGIGYRDVTVTTIVYPRNLPFTPPMARPNSPGCINLTSPNCGSLTAKWTRPTLNDDGSELKFNDISHFSVYYGTHLDSMNLDTRLARNMDEWTVANLVSGKTYNIIVTVTTQAGVESDPCLRIAAVGTTAEPKAPAGAAGLGGPTGINLGWSPVTEDTASVAITGLVTYSIYRGSAPGFVIGSGSQIIVNLADTSYFDPIIDSCNTYYYKIVAKTCGIEGSPTADIAVTTIPGPACPSGIAATEGLASGEITVSWTAPTARVDGSPLNISEIQGYYVYYSLLPGVYTDSIYVAGGTSSSHDLISLLFCETYYCNVTAVDQCGNGGAICVGLEAAARTKAPCNAMIPIEPMNIVILGGPERVDLTWTPNLSDCDLDGYRIYYGTSPGDIGGTGANQGPSPVFVDAAAVQVDTNTAKYSLTGLIPCVEYYVTIVSVDNCSPPNESAWPLEVSDMVVCGTCDLVKACATEVAEGSMAERVVFQIGNEGGSNLTINEIELAWGSGAELTAIMVDGMAVWTQDGSYGAGPNGVQSSPILIDVDDYIVYSNEDFGDPVEMTLLFNGSANGDVIDLTYKTNDGNCNTTLSPCGVMFSDGFTGPNGTTPPGWTPRTGSWNLQGNELHTTGNARITPDPLGFGNSDYTVEVDVRTTGSSSTRRAGVYVRYLDTGNYYLIRYYPSTGRIQFRKKVGSGSLQLLGETYNMAMLGPTTYRIKVSAYGSQFRVWVDDQIVDWDGIGTIISDGGLPVGNISMYAWNTGNVYYDDVVVSPTCGCGGVIP